MNLVIDASIIIAVITNEPQRKILVELTQNADLLAPHSIHWEIGNAFSAMLKRQRIGLDDALKAIKIYQTIPIRFVDVELDKSMELVKNLNMYAYDAYLIRTAIKYKSSLISLDKKLISSAKSLNISILEIPS